MGLFSKFTGDREDGYAESAKQRTFDDYIWEQFKSSFPIDASHTVKWENLETDCYRATLEDGSYLYYNSADRSARWLDAEEAMFDTEEKWKREFARRLNWVMEKRGVDQIQLSEKTGISQSAISCYTRGTRIPSAYSCLVISNALDCSLDYLQKFT